MIIGLTFFGEIVFAASLTSSFFSIFSTSFKTQKHES
jgi:hypothetical protein